MRIMPVRHINDPDPAFYKTEEARVIGDQILAFQRNTGGWPKNTDMETKLTNMQLASVLADKRREDDSTIDNGATTQEMRYLARLFQGTGDRKYADAFCKGLEYLLSGQYANGGWPQFWPHTSGYQFNITYNDDAMINTLRLFIDVVNGVEPYQGDIADAATKAKLKAAYDKGIECILNTQILVKGKPTVWCQQYDKDSLQPAGARTYELPSFCSQESALIVRFLMDIPEPDARVKKAVHGAMKWFDTYKLTGLHVERGFFNGEMTTRLVEDPAASPIWARFYDLKLIEPYVCDRDGLPRRHLEQIGRERRTGYSWYGSRPADLYGRYDEWADKYDKKNKVKISLSTKGANENGLIEMFRKHEMNPKDFDFVVKPGQSIQETLDKAPAGSKILVLKGTYHQKVAINKPGMVLIGEDKDSTILIIDDSDVPEGPHPDGTVLTLTNEGADAVVSGFTINNDVSNERTPVEETYQVPHRFAVKGSADRTIIVNCNIQSRGNNALALWASGGGMYYHADLTINCPGVDFICPRGWCYATRCKFYGGGRAMIWHDGSGDKTKRFVIKDSDFDASEPTLLGRYHHDSQFFIINCHFSQMVLNRSIQYAYSDHVLDACEWGQRVYYYNCVRDGGASNWTKTSLEESDTPIPHYSMSTSWTFNNKWDPEKVLQDLWPIIEY